MALTVLSDVKPSTASSVHQAASRAVCSAIRLCEDLKYYRKLAESLFGTVCHLEEAYHLATALQYSDRCLNLTRVFTELAETFLHRLLSGDDELLGSFKPMELCLAAVSHLEPEVSETTFSFWYYLADQLYVEHGSVASSRCHSCVERLLLALTKQVQLNPELDGEGIPDDKTEKGEFRSRVIDLVQEMVAVTGSTSVYIKLFEALKEMTNAGNNDWTLTEAFLFVMSAFVGNIVRDEDVISPQVLQLIFSFPADGPLAILNTSCIFVGEMAPWLADHPENLEAAFNFILRGIQNPKLAAGAADALEKIVARNRSKMTNALPVLLDVARSCDKADLNLIAILPILNATALAISPLERNELVPKLDELVQLQIEPLKHLIEQTKASGDHSVISLASVNKAHRHQRKHPGHWLDRIGAIFGALSTVSNVPPEESHPYQHAVDKVWPILSETARVFGQDNFTSERCCRCIRYTLRCLKCHAAAILPQVAEVLFELYQIHRHSCYVYVASIVVDEFAADPKCQQGLLSMTQALAQLAFGELSASPDAMQQRPELVDDLFRLFLRFLQQAPSAMLSAQGGGFCKTAIECAIAGLSLQHRDAHESLTHFLRELVHIAKGKESKRHPISTEATQMALELFGQVHSNLLNGVIHSGAIQLPVHLITDLAELLLEIISVCKLHHQTIGFGAIHNAIHTQLPKTSPSGSVVVTDAQLQDFEKSLEQGRSSHEIYVALKNFQRLYR